VAVTAGSNEIERGVWNVKDLKERKETAVPTAEVAQTIRKLLGS
jgi:histidyl-tRNA synthetase